MTHPQEYLNEAQSTTYQSIGAGEVFKVENDGVVKVLKDMLFDKDTLKSIASLGGNTLNQVYKDAYHSNDFSGTLRTVVLGAVALIPYGGAFISQILGAVCPNNVEDNQMKYVQDQINRLDKKIEDLSAAILKSHYDALLKELQSFERSVNSLDTSDVYYSTGDVYENRRWHARHINQKFKELIRDCNKDILQVKELPMYTTVATAYLLFLRFMEKNGKGPKIKFDNASFNEEFSHDIQTAAKEFKVHIEYTYNTEAQRLREEMIAIAQKARSVTKDYLVGNESHFDSEVVKALKKMEDKYNELLKNFMRDGTASVLSGQNTIMNNLGKDINNYRNKLDEQNKYYNRTWGNQAFRVIARIDTWIQESGKWYYYDHNMLLVNHMFYSGGKWYYLSPEKTDKLEKGQMVTGWLSLSPKEMGMVMMWIYGKNEGGNYRNELPKIMELVKKSADTKFWLYFSSNGELVYNTKRTIDRKEYEFDKYGICLNP
ncbi:insecticidal delta-endotoxin Cry8Ea1 family protein [Bacillus cereus]|uniref:insecticidal delta-endotoxin Cry8Ea1 family protein n=1 Tax=Bacillus cereus TaxID=1396 RepID=UPI003D647CD9